MKILYLSSWHPTAEFDDLSVFNELGYTWFSTGVYQKPEVPINSFRRELSSFDFTDSCLEEFKSIHPYAKTPRKSFSLPKSFVDKFDLVFVSNYFSLLDHNWDCIKHKPVIYRTYDGHSTHTEALVAGLVNEGLKLVRMFKFEERIPYAVKPHAVIRNFVNSKEYLGWTGEELNVLTVNNNFRDRIYYVNEFGNLPYNTYRIYDQVVRKHLPTKLFGDQNNVPFDLGRLSWEEQKTQYRKNRVYFSLGSKPGPYTYNLIEAMMTGMPTVNYGKILGDYDHPHYKNCYEVPDFIENGINGFYSDNIEELLMFCRELLEDPKLAAAVGENSRSLAMKLFDKEEVVSMWKYFLEKI